VKLDVEVERPSLPVPEELPLKSEPRLASSVRLVADDVLYLNSDDVVEQKEDHTVHLVPQWRQRGDEVVEDMVGEGVPPKRENHLSPPTRLVGGRWVQHNGHEGPNVVHPDSMSVEGGDGVGVEFRGVGGLWSDRGILMGNRWMVEEEALRSGHLGGQGGVHGTFLVQGERRGSFALLGGDVGRLDVGDGRDECKGCRWRSRRGCDGVGPHWSGKSGVVGGEYRVCCCSCCCAVKAPGSPTAGEPTAGRRPTVDKGSMAGRRVLVVREPAGRDCPWRLRAVQQSPRR
jgi:hypothetical protein